MEDNKIVIVIAIVIGNTSITTITIANTTPSPSSNKSLQLLPIATFAFASFILNSNHIYSLLTIDGFPLQPLFITCWLFELRNRYLAVIHF
jgi:hypothetical protein